MKSDALDPACIDVFRYMAGTPADHFVQLTLLAQLQAAWGVTGPLTLEATHDYWESPLHALCAIYRRYAFSRRGKEAPALRSAACGALKDVFGAEPSNEAILASHVCEAVMEAFHERLGEVGSGANDEIVRGFLDLTRELVASEDAPSVARWIVDGMTSAEAVEERFERLVSIRGVGPKLASQLMRDLALCYGLESNLEPVSRLYVVPVDKWLRRVAPFVIDEPDVEDMADWILAGKIAKYARLADVSCVRFTMGVSCFGQSHGHGPETFESRLLEATNPSVTLR